MPAVFCTYATFVPVPRMNPMYAEKRWPGLSHTLPARSVVTVSFRTSILDGENERRFLSSEPIHWPTISGAWICFVQCSSFASPSGAASQAYEKQNPTAGSETNGFVRSRCAANVP